MKTESKLSIDRSVLAIVLTVPADLRDDLLAGGTETVTIRVWPDGPFEFAHFKDDELADALLEMSTVPYPGGRDALIEEISKERAKPHATKKRKGPDIAAVWKRWIPDYELSKTEFTKKIWPALEGKIHAAMAHLGPTPPVMEAALEASRLAFCPYEGHPGAVGTTERRESVVAATGGRSACWQMTQFTGRIQGC